MNTRIVLIAVLLVCVNVCLVSAAERRDRLRLKARANGSACPTTADKVFPGCWGLQRKAIVDLFSAGKDAKNFCKAYKYDASINLATGAPTYGDGCAKKDEWWQVVNPARKEDQCGASATGVQWYKTAPEAKMPLVLGQQSAIEAFLRDTSKSGETGFTSYDATPAKKWQVLNVQPKANNENCYSHCVNMAFVLCSLTGSLPGQDATNKGKLNFVSDPAGIDDITYPITPTAARPAPTTCGPNKDQVCTKGCGATNNEYCFLKNICSNWSTFAANTLWTCTVDATKIK